MASIGQWWTETIFANVVPKWLVLFNGENDFIHHLRYELCSERDLQESKRFKFYGCKDDSFCSTRAKRFTFVAFGNQLHNLDLDINEAENSYELTERHVPKEI